MRVFLRVLMIIFFLVGVLALTIFIGGKDLLNKKQTINNGGQKKTDLDVPVKFDLNTQIRYFLEKTNIFTDDSIKNRVINIDSNVIGDTRLGIVDPSPHIQGWLFSYIEKDNNVLLLVGFDSAEEKRLITLVRIPVYLFDNDNEVNFYFTKLKTNVLLYDGSSVSVEVSKDRNKMIEYLNKIKGGPIIFDLLTEEVPFEFYNKAGVSLKKYYDEFNKTTSYSKILLSNIYNGFKFNLDSNGINKKNIVNLMNSDISKVDTSTIPLVFSNIYYFDSE